MENTTYNNRRHLGKQWWAPVWKGLTMDDEAKHYRRMKNAVWLFLYLLVNANRRTGVLMRKVDTICRDMGVARDTALRWLNRLRKSGYIVTLNTGRSLTIQVTKWKPLAGVRNTRSQMSELANTRSRIHPTPGLRGMMPIPVHLDRQSDVTSQANDTRINIIVNNEMHHGGRSEPATDGFQSIAVCAAQDRLAWDLANGLDEGTNIDLYRSYSHKYPEELLRRTLAEVRAVPACKIKKGRGALFIYLIQQHAQRSTPNPGH